MWCNRATITIRSGTRGGGIEETEAVGRTEEGAGEAEGREIYNRFEIINP